QTAEHRIKQEEDDQNADGAGDLQTPQGFLHFLKLAGDYVVIPGGQSYLRFDPRLDFIDHALQVAPADAEFDRDVSRVVFAVDERRAGLPGDFRELLERDALAVGRVDQDVADRFEALAVLRQEAHDDVETLFAVEQLRPRMPADRRLR